MLKFKNLVIDRLGHLTEVVLEDTRKGLDIPKEDFYKLLQDNNKEIFGIVDEAIVDTIIGTISSDYLQTFLAKSVHNQNAIVAEFPDFFRNYFLFVHACNKLFDQIEVNVVGTIAGTKEVTLFCILGNLCRMADEIGISLSNGSTKAALSLWRVLYEHAVIAIFLMQQDSTSLFEKFADHGHKNVEKQKSSYLVHYEDLKFRPLEEQQLQEILSKTKEIREKHGNDFLEEYSWAKDVIKKKKITFRDIEIAAEMDRYRPFYIWASGHIHPTFNTITNFLNKDGKLAIAKATETSLDIGSYIDPAQLTLITMHNFLNIFLFEYSVEKEYSTNLLLFRRILEDFKKTLPE